MGWKCAPQVMGLVRGEPKQGQKHRANIRKIAMEAGYERASKSDTLDKSRSKQNQYDGYSSGAEFAAVMEQEASKYRVKVNGKTKDKKPVVREKGLPHNAVIGWAVIYNPPAEVCATWTNDDYQKFYADCRECRFCKNSYSSCGRTLAAGYILVYSAQPPAGESQNQ